MDDELRAAFSDGDWEQVRLLLHPYLHWTLADGTTVRGRTNVLALMRETPAFPAGRALELRDGQVYRWS